MNTIILCGGKGERLRPLTLEIPKPMVLIKGKPILWYILKQLEKYGVNKVFISVGYKASIIKEYFKENISKIEINTIDNGDVDIIERIKSVVNMFPDEDALVLYGDTISDVDLDKLFLFSEQNRKNGTLTVWPLSTSFGIVELNDQLEIVDFKEKPKLDKWINIGYFIMRKELFKILNEFNKFEDFLKYCGKNGMLNAYKHEGEHFTVNTVVELEIVEKNIDKIFKN
jgi:glucose-1-phosphate cytidylyltransferase